jgi:hypothetical protein
VVERTYRSSNRRAAEFQPPCCMSERHCNWILSSVLCPLRSFSRICCASIRGRWDRPRHQAMAGCLSSGAQPYWYIRLSGKLRRECHDVGRAQANGS